MFRILKPLILSCAFLFAANSFACTPLGVPTVTGVIAGTDLTITVTSTTTWGCTYTYDVEIVCATGAYSGTPDYTPGISISGGPGTYAPNYTIDLSGFCPGDYKLRVREKYGAWTTSPVSADFLFTIAGPTLTVTASASPTAICFPGSSTLTATPSSACGSVSYTWDMGAGTGTPVVVSPAGTTTYTVTATDLTSCVTATSSVTVTSAPAVVPGVASVAPDPICDGDDVTLSIVGEVGTVQWQSAPTAAGPWTDIPGATTNPYTHGPVTAASDLFFQAVVSSCGDDITNVVTVTVDPPPTPAAAGPDQSVCATTGTLAGNAATVGTGAWTVTAGGGTVTTPGDPNSGVTGLTPGANTFTWTITSGVCPPSTDDITITAQTDVTAGPDNTASLCTSGGTLNLNTLLVGADPGNWVETTVPPSGTFTPGTGVFDPATLTAGDYTFEFTAVAVAPCPDDIATMTITVEEQPDAGADGSQAICNVAGSSVDLNTLLSGADPGGVWAETSASGAFTPATGVLNTDGLAASTYTFTYTALGVAPCLDDVADFTITVEQEAIAGPDNASSLCNTAGSTLNLNTLLTGAAPGGIWSETTASGQFTPATGVFDANGLTAGLYTFTYTVIGTAPCPNDVADISVTVTDLPTAGLDGATSICNSAGSTVNLNTLLSGADPGGTWSEVTASGSFTPATGILNTDGLTAGVYTFNYDIAAVGPCPGDQSTFDVTVEQEVNAGADGATSICNTAGSSVNLNTLLVGADAGGTWAETSASGAFTPATGVLNTDGLAAGVYTFTYTMTTALPCLDDVSNFTVTVEQEVFAGTDGVAQSCNNAGATVDLNTLLAGADPGGTWEETSASGAFTPGTGILNADGLTGGVYSFTYTVTAISPCANDVSNFNITVDPIPSVIGLVDEEMCDNDGHTGQVFTADVAGSTFAWTNLGSDIGFGMAGAGNVGSYTAASGSSIDVVVSVSVIATSPAGCVGDPETYNITVRPLPIISFTGTPLIGCEPHQVDFTNSSTGSAICNWDFGNGTTASGCGVVTNLYDFAGSYDVSLTVESIYGCINSDTYLNYVTVTPVPVAAFSYSPNAVITTDDTRVEFTNSSVNGDSYYWDFGDGSASSSATNPDHEFPKVGGESYTVMLIAESAAGCPDTTYKLISVEDILLFYVPNLFTPDGDTYNEIFQPVFYSGYDPYDFNMQIFNRWGEVVFQSYDASKGWDGTYGSRGLVETGTYVWQIEFGETMSDKKHVHRGHVTILK